MTRPEPLDILFAVMGTSPAVLTETLWALAGESPPIIPREIVVLTTRIGRQAIEKTLFTSQEDGGAGWNRFVHAMGRKGLAPANRLRFGMAAHHLRLFPSPDGRIDLDDIETSAHSVVAADFILRELRALTETPDTRVIASIAGGRKTMGALLTSCMILLGRSQDRLCHVLVSPPFDQMLDPLFLFPEPGALHRDREGVEHPSEAARIELIDIPFVRARGWYADRFREMPPSYSALVAQVQQASPPAAVFPIIRIDVHRGTVQLADQAITGLSGGEFGVLAVYVHLLAANIPVRTLSELGARVEAVIKRDDSFNAPAWMQQMQESSRKPDNPDDIRKWLSGIRSKLRSTGVAEPIIESLMPDFRRPDRAAYPARRIRISGGDLWDTSADVRQPHGRRKGA